MAMTVGTVSRAIDVPRGRALTPDQMRHFRSRVSEPARASSRLMFVLMAAFAAPLWVCLGRRRTCFHLYGCPAVQIPLAMLPACLYGQLDLTQWAALARQPKKVAVGASEGLLILVEDETPDRTAMLNAIAAMWGHTPGFLGSMRVPIPSRTDGLTLSAGNSLIDQALVFVAAPPGLTGGIALVNIPSDAGCGHGIFEVSPSPGHVEMMAVALMQLRGAVGLHWLEMLNFGWSDALRVLSARNRVNSTTLSVALDPFTLCPVQELALDFRTIAAVGELASEWGVTGWKAGEASQAVAACEKAWQAGNAARLQVMRGQLRPAG